MHNATISNSKRAFQVILRQIAYALGQISRARCIRTDKRIQPETDIEQIGSYALLIHIIGDELRCNLRLGGEVKLYRNPIFKVNALKKGGNIRACRFRQAKTMRAKRILKHNMQAAGTAPQIFQRLRIGALKIAVVDARQIMPASKSCFGVMRTCGCRIQRLKDNAVGSVRDELVKGGAFEGGLNKRPPVVFRNVRKNIRKIMLKCH